MYGTEKIPYPFTDEWRPYELPRIKPRLDPFDCTRLAAMGSCFARNLARWIYHHTPIDRHSPWETLFNPFVLEAEFRRLFAETDWRRWVFHERGKSNNTQLRDPWRTWLVEQTLSELAQANDTVDRQAQAHLANASCMLITLGLAEVWSPREDRSIVVNRVPQASLPGEEDRWVSRLASVDEVIRSLIASIDTLRKHVSSELPVILTVSPVPLRYTASGLSVQEANTISKATLICAAHAICSERERVTYFPSYEIVNSLAFCGFDTWQSDGRHVTVRVVDRVARTFLDLCQIQTLCSGFRA
jgi:hypothetical protein